MTGTQQVARMYGVLCCLAASTCEEGDVPPPGEPGPEAVVMAEAVSVEMEIAVTGAVDHGVALTDHAILASRGGELLRRGILDDAPEELGTDAGALLGAARFNAQTLFAASDGLFVLVDGLPERSPLDALFAPGSVRQMLVPEGEEGDDLWIATADAVRRYRGGTLSTLVPGSLRTDGALMAFGAPVNGQPALWILANGVASAWSEDADGFSAQPLDLADVRSFAVDGAGALWLVAGETLYRRNTDGSLREIDFPEPLSTLFAGATAADLWLSDGKRYWHHGGGTFTPLDDVPDGTPLGVDSIGRLLMATVEGLARVSLGRPLVFVDIADGSRVDLDTTVTVAPAFLDRVSAVEAAVDDGALAVLQDPWRAVLPAEALSDGEHRLDVTVRYAVDMQVAESTLYFHKGDVAPVTWANDIGPLYLARCDFCHGAAGGAHRLDTPAAWQSDIDDILTAVRSGSMPRLPPRLDDDQIHMIERWRAGGYQ